MEAGLATAVWCSPAVAACQQRRLELPLFPQPRPGNVEPEATYLRQLQDAVDTARQRGDRLAGTAIALDTLPKK